MLKRRDGRVNWRSDGLHIFKKGILIVEVELLSFFPSSKHKLQIGGRVPVTAPSVPGPSSCFRLCPQSFECLPLL